MSDSPINELLKALHASDLDRVVALAAPEIRLLTADGRRAEGREAARQLLSGFLKDLRSASYRILAEWHQDDVWVAEVEADYELRDWLQLKSLPRAFILHAGTEGIRELHVYGAHERPVTEHRTGEEGIQIAARWVPPL